MIRTDEHGNKQEPIEQLIISVDDNQAGTIIETVSNRKGMLQSMNSENGLTTIE
ncbi:hypothetical protein KA478_05155, partial [Patescibacteria group bacterium]|nr:hypothetical protein [Patescibacteria group bacterium]